jgi:hypothetical protein
MVKIHEVPPTITKQTTLRSSNSFFFTDTFVYSSQGSNSSKATYRPTNRHVSTNEGSTIILFFSRTAKATRAMQQLKWLTDLGRGTNTNNKVVREPVV